MSAPEDRALEALLREQTLLPVPLALVGRILDEVLPVEPVRPWALVGRAAAAAVIFLGSWLAFAGDVPALADVAPPAQMAAALPAAPPVPSAASWAEAAGAPEADATLWLAAGALLLVAGVAGAWRAHRRRATPGGAA